jgi:hypothetical protein
MVVPQVHLRRTADGHTLILTSVRLEQIRPHSLLNPNGLRSRPFRHLIDIWEVELALGRFVVGSEHVLLYRLSQQSLNRHHSLRQTIWSQPVLRLILGNPATIDENCSVSLETREFLRAIQRRHNLESRLGSVWRVFVISLPM